MTEQSKLKADLEKLTLEYTGLFQLDATLTSRYNGFLQTIFGINNSNTRLGIDMRGMSPELEPAFGDYLTIREVSPYAVIISPDQAQTPMIKPAFSFEEDFMRTVYKKAKHITCAITPNEVLWGELENGLDIMTSLNDLLKIDSISLNLDTPLETLKDIYQLQVMHFNLKQNLSDNNKVNAMIEMHKKLNRLKYGDIRGVELNGTFPMRQPVDSFYTRLAGGVYVIRDHGRVIVIYDEAVAPKTEFSDKVIAIDKHNPELLEFMRKVKFIDYKADRDVIEKAVRNVEDRVLLDNAYDLFPNPAFEMRPFEMKDNERYLLNRKRGLARYAHQLPESWHELNELHKKVINRETGIAAFISQCKPETKVKLAVPIAHEELVGPLLLELDLFNVDFDMKANIAPDRLLEEYNEYNKATKKYMCYKINRRD